jgi:TrmH family RNA methyltransferase
MPWEGTLSSPHNPRIRATQRLISSKRDRYRERQYVIEGYRLVEHALARGCRPAFAFHTAAFAATGQGASLVTALSEGPTPVWEVSPDLFDLLAGTVTPQGIVAVMPMPAPDMDRMRAAGLVLVLDALGTPGNLGTILRTALATGVGGVVCTVGTVDPFSPKAVRGGMGAQMDLPILTDVPHEDLGALLAGRPVYAAAAEGERTLWDVDWTVPAALVIGSEAHGVGAELRGLAAELLRVPMAPEAESLNAAVAAAAFMFAALRQRLTSQRPVGR